tara:strand:- start:51912 stop:52298 length:387 start_codon:yes stop_codon:yes gene_type:complete
MRAYFGYALDQFFHKSLTTLMLFAVLAIFIPCTSVYAYFGTRESLFMLSASLVFLGASLCILTNIFNVFPRRLYYFIVYALVVYCWLAASSAMLESVLTIFTVHALIEFIVLPIYFWKSIKKGVVPDL